jgi:hypothetical protein
MRFTSFHVFGRGLLPGLTGGLKALWSEKGIKKLPIRRKNSRWAVMEDIRLVV